MCVCRYFVALPIPMMPLWVNRFASVSHIFTCDVMLHIIHTLLVNMTARRSRLRSEIHFEKCLHLITMGLHEDKLQYNNGNQSLKFVKACQSYRGMSAGMWLYCVLIFFMKWLPLSCQYFIAAIILKMIIHILVLDGLEKELVIIEYYNQLTSCLFCVSFKVRSIRFSHQYRLLPIWLSRTTWVGTKVTRWDVVNEYEHS